jgi:hypothetical protein
MKLLIHQPGKVGDIIICLPIAAWYAKKGYDVHWLCPEKYHSMFQYVDYVRPVSHRDQYYHIIIDLSFGIIQGTPLHRQWIKRHMNGQSFVDFKYEIAGVPKAERHNLQYIRNHEREKQLFEKVTTVGKPYDLVHPCSDYGSVPDINAPDPLLFAPVDDYTVFDWREVIEKARSIHCIDSSLANFVEVIRPDVPMFFYRVPERNTESEFDFTKWQLIDMNKMQTA